VWYNLADMVAADSEPHDEEPGARVADLLIQVHA
jgi:hypothetical protein